ncbi:MAG TPA: ammonia-forming cytochrome c nitrite reductase subunit c552 [Anaerolineae bacterium]|nr:ammonia-forming cytochrome c nitrite reductase subunit c552 [Anaerolineae bacterium]
MTLFAGYGFGKDHDEERGHLNSLIDVRTTKRVNEATPGTCYSCKGADTPRLWAQMGMAEFDGTAFSQLTPQIQNPIGCANCHVEYYFSGEGKLLTLPSPRGTRVEDIAACYQELGFSDWQSPSDGAALAKMQHPEYELYTAGSAHYTAGVSCADCHMPYTRDGAAKFSTHNVAGPLLNANVACATCHTNVSYVTARVKDIQAQVRSTMDAAEDALVAASGAIGQAGAAQGAAGRWGTARRPRRLAWPARAFHRIPVFDRTRMKW